MTGRSLTALLACVGYQIQRPPDRSCFRRRMLPRRHRLPAREFNLTLADGSRFHGWDFRHNDLSMSFRRRIDVDERPATLIVKYDGDRVLIAQWTIDGFSRRSYSAGSWEAILRRCEQLPALVGQAAP